MKTIKLMISALCAAVLAVFCLIGCEKLDTYSIDSPDDLQHRIDSIEAAKPNTGDTIYLIISKPMVGNEDNSSGWWSSFSDYFAIPSNKLLHMEFINYGSGVNNWNNWNMIIANLPAHSTDNPDLDGDPNYKEYFVLRSDAFGWGGTMAEVDERYAFDIGMIAHDYPDTDGDEDIWNDFRNTMQGATVSIEVDHSATGNAYVTATAVGTNGTTITETYQQGVSATEDIVASLVADASHFQMIKAYLLPSKKAVVEDVNPESIVIEGAPASVEIGNSNFWGDAIARVTFADGSSAEVDSADLSFNVIPDMTTLGEKTVIVAYSKTKQGSASSKAVSTAYTLEVTNSVASISANDIDYYYFSDQDIKFNPQGIIVTATYSDGSTAVLEKNVLDFNYPDMIPAEDGTQTVDITYAGTTGTFTTTSTVTLIKGVGQVGNSDLSSVWWTAFSPDYTVAPNSSKTITMYCYSDNLANWHSPCTILRKADNTEYGVVRMDNYGWGTGYGTATLTSNWNWDVFMSSISGSKVVITVTNNGDNTADVLYTVTYANGETHFQKYAGVTVDSSDLNCALVTEVSYLVLVD